MRYEVFARINAGDDLLHVGHVDAASDRLAASYARTTYDEEAWDFMAVVRAENLVEVPTSGELRPDSGGDAE